MNANAATNSRAGPAPPEGAAAAQVNAATAPRAAGEARGIPPEPHTLAVANAALRSGFVLLPRTILHATGISRDAKLLYAVLLSYAWQEGSCFPGYERLMEDLQCSINSVTKYMVELEQVGLISRHRRGLGKTNIYTINDLPALPATAGATSPALPATAGATSPASPTPPTRAIPPLSSVPPTPAPAMRGRPGVFAPVAPQNHTICESRFTTPVQSHKTWESGVTTSAAAEPHFLRPEQHAEEYNSAQQPAPAAAMAPAAATAPATEAVVALLLAQGVTRRTALALLATYDQAAIRAQLEYARYRTAVKNPAGALVKAIREDWAPPPAWLEARERAAALVRQAQKEAAQRAEEETRRRQWAVLPPEERVQGRLEFWITRERFRGHEPTPAEIAAQRTMLIAQLAPPESPAGGSAGP